ncbi:MAG: hypothetical protein LBD27_00230 [Tannerella sp.]|nr:hypothetical protein [Tannerella sp.]
MSLQNPRATVKTPNLGVSTTPAAPVSVTHHTPPAPSLQGKGQPDTGNCMIIHHSSLMTGCRLTPRISVMAGAFLV